MSIRTSIEADGRKVVIRISGRFDFSQHVAFREAYRNQGASTEFVVDLRDAEYLDSSALGMLLLLREHAGGDKSRISILGARDDVRRVLEIANFDRLFRLG